MREIFLQYLLTLARPFHTHTLLREARVAQKELGESPFSSQIKPFDFVEMLSVSWLMAILKAIYAVIAIFIGLRLMGESPALSESFTLTLWSSQIKKITLYMIILEVILFPLTLFFYTKFWALIIKFFCSLFDYEEDVDHISYEIVHQSLASNFFLIIPIFGNWIRHFAGLFLIYAGLRKNLGFNRLQSLMVLSAPLFLVLFFIFLTLLYLMLIFSLI